MGERADTGPLARSAEDAALRARIEQQIGRNVLLYQRIELVLKKMLVMGARAEGPIDCIPARLEKRSRQVLQSTLGELAGRVFREVLGAPEAAADACTSNADSIRVSFSHVIEAAPGSNDFDRLQEALATLAQRRNFIVHQFLQDRTLTTADGRRAVLSALEDDHATAERLHGQLEVLADQMQAVLAARASFLQSDEFADALDESAADLIRTANERAGLRARSAPEVSVAELDVAADESAPS